MLTSGGTSASTRRTKADLPEPAAPEIHTTVERPWRAASTASASICRSTARPTKSSLLTRPACPTRLMAATDRRRCCLRSTRCSGDGGVAICLGPQPSRTRTWSSGYTRIASVPGTKRRNDAQQGVGDHLSAYLPAVTRQRREIATERAPRRMAPSQTVLQRRLDGAGIMSRAPRTDGGDRAGPRGGGIRT